MPVFNKYPVKKHRKGKRYRSTKYRLAPLINRGVPSGMPTQRTASLRYVTKIELTPVLGALRDYIFRANSLFDPDQTGAGHQPMGRDTWATLYNHYVVLGSKITIEASQQEASGSVSNIAAVGVYLNDSITIAYTDMTEYAEARRGQYKLVNSRQTKPAKLSNSFSAKNFFNITDVKDNKSEIGALVGFNPTEAAYYHVWGQTMDSSTTVITYIVTIDYIVSFSEPKSLAQS